MTADSRTIDYGERGTVLVVQDAEALAVTAAGIVRTTIDAAATAGHRALIALSGGSTPKRMGQLFAGEPLTSAVQWTNVEIFWGDERWVPIDDPESNAGEATRGFLNDVPISPDHVHPFTTEGIEPAQSAAELAAKLTTLQPDAAIPVFDLVLLGMGDDGHTASLFPGTAAVHEEHELVLSHWVDKLNTTRLTFTPPLINAASAVVFLVGGAGKADMLTRVLDGPIEVDATPSQVIRPTAGTLTWIVDEAAAAKLEWNTGNG